jgi:hypothetical protein
MGNVACLQQERAQNFQGWSRWIYTLPGEYKGLSKRTTTNEITQWKSLHLFVDNVDSTTKKASLFGVGISLFRNQEMPFIIIGKVDQDRVTIEKLHYNSNNIQNKVLYKLEFDQKTNKFKAIGRHSFGLISKINQSM